MRWWENTPWRMIQTNLREIDYIGFDPERMVADLKSFHATVALVNAGGISASYPTALPWHYQNPYALHDGLKTFVELCHDNGIHVIARTDFSKVRQELADEHPDWTFRTDENGVMNYNGYVQTCPNSVYQQEYAFLTLKEIFEQIPFDGLFCNMGGFQTRDYSFVDYGFCHCESCRENFKKFSGYDHLPEKEDMNDAVYVSYTEFQKHVIREYRKKMRRFLDGLGRDLCFDDVDYARIEASTELNRRLPHWIYHASSNCRVILGDGSKDIICSNTTVDYLGYSLRDVSVGPELHKLRLLQNLTNLGALDFYIMGRLDDHLDKSGFESVRKVFDFHAGHEREYSGLKNSARVLLRRSDRWVATEEEKGWIRILTESHVPFAEILPTEYEEAHLNQYDLVILPDNQYLTPGEIERTDRYVEAGGKLLCVGGTGLADDRKGRKKSSGLRCMGITEITEERNGMASAMLLITPEEKKVFTSFPDCDVIALGERFLFATALPETQRMLRLVPVHPFGPPECCYFTSVGEENGVYVNTYGGGKAVYVPWYPGELFARTGFVNLKNFMRDVLLNICGAQTVAESLSSMVEVSIASKRNGDMLVQLVNNSGCFGGSFEPPLPVRDITIKFASDAPSEVYSLKDSTVQWEYHEGQLECRLACLMDYDAIAVKL